MHCGKLFDSEKGRILTEQTIVVEGITIKAVEKGYLPANNEATIINLKDKTVYPGFIDMHVHIEGETSPQSYLNRFRLNDADVAYDAAVFAERTLMAGFTTVRDMGGSGVNIALSKAIEAGKVSGPRIFTAGKALGDYRRACRPDQRF